MPSSSTLDKDAQDALVSKSAREIQLRSQREDSIVVFNVPESEQEETELRIEEDREKFKQICDAIDQNEVTFGKIRRTGRKTEDYPKKMIVEIKDSKAKNRILRASGALKDHQNPVMRKIFMKKNQTPLQQKEAKAYYEMMRAKEKEEERRCYVPGDHSECMKSAFTKADFDSMRREHADIEWDKHISNLDTKDTWTFIKDKILETTKKYVPLRRHNPTARRKPLWLNPKALAKVKKKREAYKRYLETKEGKDYDMYARLRNQVKWEVRKAKKNHEREIAENAKRNPKAFYQYARSKMKTKCGIPNLTNRDGNQTENDHEKAEVLNDFFTSVFTIEDKSNIPPPDLEPMDPNDINLELFITPAEVRKKLEELKVSKSPGPDGIHPRVLKELSNELAIPLSLLLNKSLNEGKLPSDWKKAQITALHKKGNIRSGLSIMRRSTRASRSEEGNTPTESEDDPPGFEKKYIDKSIGE
ncbi:uncharacterized protein LOC135494302 [Lineus longissimus]|uniref:uncharacterized protein LOC135494294 n=1 Tax=Lineus longissimus TaxID=88925 RepID=UPI00315D5C88